MLENKNIEMNESEKNEIVEKELVENQFNATSDDRNVDNDVANVDNENEVADEEFDDNEVADDVVGDEEFDDPEVDDAVVSDEAFDDPEVSDDESSGDESSEDESNEKKGKTKKSRQRMKKFRSKKEESAYNDSVAQCGIMFPDNKKVNCHCVAKFISLMYENLIFEPEEKEFYEKDTSKGLWQIVPRQKLSVKLMKWMNTFSVEVLNQNGHGALLRKGIGEETLLCLEEHVEKNDFFKRRPGEYVIHTQNCFLKYDLQDKKFTEIPLTDESIISRHQLNVKYEPDKESPMFMEHLLKPMLSTDEIEVLLQYFGMCLINDNISQKIFMINGCAGGGKSTCVNVIEKMIGRENVAEFRVQRATSGFETNRYIGKSLLCGKDVPANFLKCTGAAMLKALTGKDWMETEAKHSNAKGHITGNLNVILVSNCNQPVPVNGDRDAWARRLLIVKFKGTKPANPITNFDEYLLEKEGPGILNAVLIRLKKVLDNEGIIAVSAEQKQAIESLLDESEGVKLFVQNCIETVNVKELPGTQCQHDISTMEAYIVYKDFCQKREWSHETLNSFEKMLPDCMAEIHSRQKCNDIHRDGNTSTVRGYHAVRFTTGTNLIAKGA